ncbi:pyruvate kinase [Sulfolobales archaeon HS-7]|nr:pyruvate kinase [Sulfolobales archaeon HS-7]
MTYGDAQHHLRKTKVIATMGPSIEGRLKDIRNLIDGMRVNLAHGTIEQQMGYIEKARELYPVIVDLPGSKIRVETVAGGIRYVKKGEIIELGKDIELSWNIEKLAEDGDAVVFGDSDAVGRIMKKGEKLFIEFENGGIVVQGKGMSLSRKRTSGLTHRDLQILPKVMALKPDFVSVSFVSNADEIRKVKGITAGSVGVIAKVERRESLNNITEIIQESDVIMVARGDLGVDIGLENLPEWQRKIIELSQSMNKPVLLATQVLESMVTNPSPTRAEVIDVSTSVAEGVDGIILSEETAIGKYPLEALQFLNKLIIGSESKGEILRSKSEGKDPFWVSVASMADSMGARAIVVRNASEDEIKQLASLRPSALIIPFTRDYGSARRMSIIRGCFPNRDELIPRNERYIVISGRSIFLQN